jgi:hypothetical protein
MIKVFSLHAKFSSFFATCFGELATKHDAKIRMVCVRPHAEAPFDESIYDAANLEKRWFKDEVDISMILREIEAFQPDVILVSGWFMPEYLQVCKWYHSRIRNITAHFAKGSGAYCRGGVCNLQLMLFGWLVSGRELTRVGLGLRHLKSGSQCSVVM